MCKDEVLVNRKEHRKLEFKGFEKWTMKIEDDQEGGREKRNERFRLPH